MRKTIAVSIILCFLACPASICYPADKKSGISDAIDVTIDTAANIIKAPLAGASDKPSSSEKDKKDKAAKKFTREEMLDHTLMLLEHEEEVLNYIPELRKEKGPDGKISYRFKGVRLEDLDEKGMEEAFRRINNEASRIRAERLNKQLENIQRTQQAVAAAQQAVRQNIITQPVVVRPPQPPPSVPKPPQIPQIPKPPPQPPTRQR